MPNIEISEETLHRLKSLAEPLVDTTDTIINKALNALEKQSGNLSVDHERQVDLERMPSMLHTKVLDASIAGVPASKLRWNHILRDILRLAAERNEDLVYLRNLAQPLNMVGNQRTGQNYVYLPELGVSLQEGDANRTCQAIISASKSLGLALDIGFEWRDKDGAEHPGQRGRIRTS